MGANLEDLVKTTTRGSLILLIGQVSSTLILAFGMLLVAYFLGPVNFGAFSKAQSVVQIAVLVMNFGVHQAMVKYISLFRYEGKDDLIRVFIETGVIITTTLSIVFTFLVYLLSGFIANEIFRDSTQELFIKYLSLSILGQGFSTLAQGVTIGFERMELRSLIQISYSFIKSVISPLLVYIGLGTLGAVLGHTSPILISGAIGSFFVIILYRNHKSTSSSISHFEAFKLIFNYSFPLYLSSLLGGLLPQIYTTLLGIWETDEHIGNYSVALNFSVLLTFVTLPISTTIFPLFSKLENNQNELEFLYRNAVKYSTLFGYPITFTIIALSNQIISVLFQDKYVYAPNYLRIYMLTSLLIGLGSVCNGSLLSGQNRNDVNFKSTFWKFIISLPLSYISIQLYGVTGLLYTFFISSFINTSINNIYIRRIFGFKIDKMFLIKIFIISTTSCFLVYHIFNYVIINLWVELVLGGLLSLFIYLFGIILLKVLTKQDYSYLKKLSDSFGPIAPLFKWTINKLLFLSK